MAKDRSNYCDDDCNKCPVIGHRNARMVTYILNSLLDKFGDGVYEIVQTACPNLTCCAECNQDDFCHDNDCTIIGGEIT